MRVIPCFFLMSSTLCISCCTACVFLGEGHNWNCKLYCTLEGCIACFRGVLREFL
ncbi:hypothetical protein HanXRQr2_Chr04g0146631 [Helianthus annuus]|uniref:Uncharacterized protein n=1 Tax=Helianthus annuus TaxID=4232 RepID=A0A9K3J581_HELAN|nr:hypothetical protein HanXRQr2_Chr04g0146631 [Helianthus annuus]KAJ0929768.1 hypothetical protein HanPSC8_Chr04g0141411 [Helianthus annuus]